jgi:hypothetical protein
MGTASESIPKLSLRRRGEPQIVIMEIKDFLKTISTEKKVIYRHPEHGRETG